MPATTIEFYAGGLIDGWSQTDIDALDIGASEVRIVEILRGVEGVAPDATVTVRWESAADRIFGRWDYATEEEELKERMVDLPWWDGNWWGVAK
jgi:hypothetical protein